MDEVRFSGDKTSGNFCSINALGAGVKDGVRTKSSFAHEGKTLKEIVAKIAAKYNYKVQGIIHNYSIARVTQFHETDIGFLHRLAEEYGYMFNLRGNILVFTYLPELSKKSGGAAVKFTDMVNGYTIVDKVAGIYVRGQNRYHNPKTKTKYESLVEAGALTSADVMRLQHHVDNEQQGIYIADGRMYKKNLDQIEISGAIEGSIYIVSGNNAVVTGDEWGVYAGNYFIAESRHTISKDGSYVTGATYKKILANKPTGNPTGTEYGYTPQASISTEANDIIANLKQLITAINSNTLSTGTLNMNHYAIIDKDVKSMQQKQRMVEASSVNDQYMDIYNSLSGALAVNIPITASNSTGVIEDINTLITYLKTLT